MQIVMTKNQYDLDTAMPIGNAEIHVFLEEGLSDPKKWVFTNSFSIGRHKSADVLIQNTSVSRFHAVVYYSKGEWWVLDMSSLNGTIVDGQKIARRKLGSQSHLRLGANGPVLNLYTQNNIYAPKLKNNQEDPPQLNNSKLRVILTDENNEQKEWTFARHFIIGRHTGADIRIKDNSVSRFHSLVNFREGKWWIKDLSSANGTLVNGQKKYEQLLCSQTQVRLGRFGPILNMKIEEMRPLDSVYDKADFNQDEDHKYTIINDTDYKAEKHTGLPIRKEVLGHTNAPLKKYRKCLACLATIILICIGLAGYVHLLERPKSPVDGNELKAAEKPIENAEISSNSFQRKNATTEMKIADVNDPQEAPQKATNTVENQGKEMAIDRNTTALNHTSEIYFNAAKKFSKYRYWNVALEYYQNVNNINPDFPDLRTEIARMKYESDNMASYEEGVTYTESGRYEEGIYRLKSIPKNSVYHDDASQIIAQTEKQRAQQNSAKALAAKNTLIKDNISKALQYYAQGKIKLSVGKLNKVLQSFNRKSSGLKYRNRAKDLKKQIEHSASLYYKGNQEYESGQYDNAINTWKQLLEIDKKLVRRQDSYFAKIVSRKMANDFSSKALKSYSDDDLPSAYAYTKIALNLRADHAKSLEILNMLKEKSKQLFQDGYILEEYNPEKAMEKWKLILKICSPESEYYKKALKKIGTM
jgi:pSer/pThr/pTyr-binding forkhead associated (FHA) protein/tetratricopeptide (TPR) repeat protein